MNHQSRHQPNVARQHIFDAVEKSVPLVDFLVTWVGTLEDLTTSDGRARATRHIAELIGRVTDATLRQFLIRDAAERIGIEESVVIRSVQDAKKSPRPHRREAPRETTVSVCAVCVRIQIKSPQESFNN